MAYKKEEVVPVDKKSALFKAEHFCAYQERSQQEVRDKLFSFGLKPGEVEEVIAELIEGNFLNEERFAYAYALGKFRMKGWGRQKIKQALKLKRVSPKLIELALKQINGDDYFERLKVLLVKKEALLKEADPFKRRLKLIQYGLSKGFEKDLILDALSVN